MSCPNANAPIDINVKNIAGKCDLKCAYNFKYLNSSCVVTNRGEYISIAYDASSTPPVTYNNVGYNVNEVRIYSPSIHTFNGIYAVAEMIIIHVSNKGTKPLLVCVPFIKDNSETKSSSIISNIVNTMTNSAPSDGESTTVYMDDFTLDAFVPKKPYFSYTAIQPYQPCVGDVDLIVFGIQVANSCISEDTLSKLNTIISANSYTIKSGPLLFFNAKGPGSSGLTDEIFIDCKPIDRDSEQVKITTNISSSSSSSSVDMNDIINSPAFQVIVGSLLFIFIIFVFSAIIKAIGGSSIELPKMMSKKS